MHSRITNILNESSQLQNRQCLILKLFVISMFFEIFSFSLFENLDVTFFILLMIPNFIVGLFLFITQKLFLTKSSFIALIMCGYLVLNHFITGAENTSSLLLSLAFLGTALLLNPVVHEKDYNKLIQLFQLIINITAIYGIIQFFVRLQPGYSGFFDIKTFLEEIGHFTKGYNWTNPVSIGELLVWRSNSIYLEPSFFSQVLAINIVLYLNRMLHKEENHSPKTYTTVLINFIAFVLSFSGTGILVLCGGLILILLDWLKEKKIKKAFQTALGISIFAIILICILYLLNILDYFIGRLGEFSNVRSSGYTRISSTFEFISVAWKDNFLFGSGIGTIKEYATQVSTGQWFSEGNGVTFVAVSMGFIGLVLWLVFLYKLKTLDNGKNTNIKSLYFSLFPLLLCSSAFHDNLFWIFIMMINVKIIYGNEVNNAKICN